MQASAKDAERKSWSVVAPFFSDGSNNRWIDDFIPDPRWTFRKVPLASARDDWHSRLRRTTGVASWLRYWKQSRSAFPASGVITVFPQPALTTAIQATLYGLNVPLLAWCFNLGGYPHGLKRAGARMALRSVDRFVVHSTAEVDRVSEFLDLAPGKVEFVPLQRAPIPIEEEEDVISPFVVALGSANRDYETFFKAAEISKLPCKVVASPRALAGLRLPPNVSVGHGLTPTQCHRLVQQSRFSVVALHDPNIASGQVTVIESMRMNTPVVATSSIGTTDYVQQHYSGTLVPPHDPERLAAAMLELWHDAPLRERYAHNAAEFAKNSLSDEAAARALARIVSELELEQ